MKRLDFKNLCWRRCAFWFACLCAGTGVVALMTVQLSHAYCIYCDSGYYLSISNRLSEGCTLYKDVACGYSPLHLYVCAGLKWLFAVPHDCYWPYLLLQQFLRIGVALFVYGIGREMRSPKFAAFLAACYACMLLFKEEGGSVLLEVPSVFWGLGGCFFLLRLRNKSVWHCVWIGMVLSGAYLCKQYGLGFLPLALLLVFFFCPRSEWAKRIGGLLAGFLIPMAVVLLLFGESFYHVLFPSYGTSFLEGTPLKFSLQMRISKITDATFGCMKNYALLVAVSVLLLPFAFKQRKWAMYVFCLCGFFGFSLQYYFTITAGEHYVLYMIPFVALLVAWVGQIKAPKWLLAVVWLSVAYMFFERGRQLVKKNVPVWKDGRFSANIRNMTDYCDRNIPAGAKVFLEDYGVFPVYYNANIVPPLLKERGYSFGPSGLNRSQALRQLEDADFAILSENRQVRIYYYSGELYRLLEGYPCEIYGGHIIYDLRDKPFVAPSNVR